MPNSVGYQTSLFALGKALLLYFNKARSADHDLRAWFKFEKGDKEFVETE